MKKLISIILTFTVISSVVLSTNTYAKANDDIGTYSDINGDIITIEAINTNINVASDKTVYKTRISRNGQYEETISVNFSDDKIIHEYADGSKITDVLSDIVTITPVVSTDGEISGLQDNGNILLPRSVDYIDNEHFDILSNGDQAILSGASVYDGYRAMGYRGGYSYAPNAYGYLQRRNSGILDTQYSNRFSFSAGTTISTAASIIVAAVTSGGWSLAVSLVVAMLGPVIDVVTYDWSVKFERRTYIWSYRVRLNSNTGQIIYTTYRTKDYWLAHNEATGAAEFEYAGTRYDDGYLFSNYELIEVAVNSYISG